jgi:hypothetical protein
MHVKPEIIFEGGILFVTRNVGASAVLGDKLIVQV